MGDLSVRSNEAERKSIEREAALEEERRYMDLQQPDCGKVRKQIKTVRHKKP